jgi:hypothetical protein
MPLNMVLSKKAWPIEAMACGTLVVLTEFPGQQQYAEDGVNCLRAGFRDVPGVAASALRVLFKHGTLVIVGEKLATEPVGADGSAFHLVERGFGRFARVVRLNAAISHAS